jgi:hypothetical protein
MVQGDYKAGAFLYGKISNSKIGESCSLKSCGHSLGTFFVSMTFQIFECGWARLGLEDRKNGQKTQKKSVFWRFFQKLKSKS